MTIELIDKGSGERSPTTLHTLLETSTGGSSAVLNMYKGPGEYVLTGSLTADTYPVTPQIELIGSGVIGAIGVGAVNDTARTVTCKIEIDGVVVLEEGADLATALKGIYLIGMVNTAIPLGALDQIPFKKSLKIYVKSDLTETDFSFIKYYARVTS